MIDSRCAYCGVEKGFGDGATLAIGFPNFNKCFLNDVFGFRKESCLLPCEKQERRTPFLEVVLPPCAFCSHEVNLPMKRHASCYLSTFQKKAL